MKKKILLTSLIWFCGLLMTAKVGAEPPRFVNAKLQILSPSGGLEGEFRALVSRQVEPAWIGYSVPATPGKHGLCCYDSVCDVQIGCGRCRLEAQSGGVSMESDNARRVSLEAEEPLVVLFRLTGRKVEKIRMFSQECELDAGGVTVYWFSHVRPTDSIVLLSSFVSSSEPQGVEESRRLRSSAVAAIAMHADKAADKALEQFVSTNQPEALRRDTIFWLGSARGRQGYEILRRVVREDLSDKVREHAVFALSISKEPEALNTMIDLAHHDANADVRGQALFWLAQKAGQKALGAISEAIENDPETEVKKRAVFALSRLPSGEGVPKLIEVAKSNRNPVVRKQALFWLGQSKDPRALNFIEEVLLR